MAAMATVYNEGETSSNVPPASQAAGQTVATLTYQKDGKNYTQEFKSDAATTNDDALQAALVKASQVSGAKKGTVKVTLSQDVTVDGIDASTANKYAIPQGTDQWGIMIGGTDVTLDLGGKTITDGIANSNGGTVSLASGTNALQGTETATETVYATSEADAKAKTSGKVWQVANSSQAPTYDAAKVTSATAKDSNYYVWTSGNDWAKYNTLDAAQNAAQAKGQSVYQQFDVTYTKAASGNYKRAINATIVNGTIASAQGDKAAVYDWGKGLTLGKDAKVVLYR